MSEVNSARPSPRFVNGVLKWYAGDTFDVDFEVGLVDQDGTDIVISPGDKLTFAFKNARREDVKKFEFTGVTDGKARLYFSEATSALFPAGRYTYDVIYTGTNRRTIARNNPCVVE